ncbi:MAG: phosphodiester glycosidase family protein [Pedobacter sp.]|nr:MAG: phosphodiester glycosidase family protein [Pedobacter sp.]
MFRKSIILSLFVCAFQYSYAQNTDSLTFVKSKWIKKSIGSKSKLITHHFADKNLFGANQNISYIEIKNLKKKGYIAIGQEVKILKPTSKFGRDLNALAAVNGTFFDIKNGGSVDLIKTNGLINAQNRIENGGGRSAHQQAAIAISNGLLDIKKWDGSENWESNLAAEDIMVSGPLLRINNKDEKIDSGSFSITRHPRTAVGIAGNKVIILTVDGRHENSAGMSLFELSKIMKWLGCSASINLDGGGSTTMWVHGFGDTGVVNYPSDNKKWDHNGERNVANVILLKKKP